MKELRRYLSLAVAGLFLSCVFSASALAVEYVSVKKDDTIIRSGPGNENPEVMRVFRGFPLQVQETKGKWLHVIDYEKGNGWISKDMTDNTQTVIVITKPSANMRQEANTKSAKIAEVDAGVVLQLVGKKGDWRQVKHSGGKNKDVIVGWLHKNLVWPQ